MKKAKLELDSLEASILYRGLAAYEREVAADIGDSPATRAFTLVSIDHLKDKVAVIFEKTRPIEKEKGAKSA